MGAVPHPGSFRDLASQLYVADGTTFRLPHASRPALMIAANDMDYQHFDFAPTIADAVGLTAFPSAESISALSGDRSVRDKIFGRGTALYRRNGSV